jgi:hypothetical protein
MCEQIEQKFFTGSNQFLFGDKPMIVDYVFYQEILSAMVLSGHGTASEFLVEDIQDRFGKLKNVTSWYNNMSKVPACERQAIEFIRVMDAFEEEGKDSNLYADGGSRRKNSEKKHVRFAPQGKSVKFGSELETIE